MRAYILRRLVQLVPVLVGVSIVVFTLIRLIPGDVVYSLLGSDPKKDDVEALRRELKLDRPIPEQYLAWIGNVAKGDLGKSLVYSKKPVVEAIGESLPVTIELSFLSTLLALAIGIPIAVLSAIRQDTWPDYVGRIIALLGLSIPNFWLATLLFLVAAVNFGWVPSVQGYTGFFEDPWLNIQQFILPTLAGSAGFAAIMMRMTRSTLLEVMSQDYIRTAWAKGLNERTVVVRHGLRNALIPVATLIGLHFGAVLGGAVILENIFALPGMGRLLLSSVGTRDYPTIQGVVLFLALVYVTVNLFVDISYAWLDPRIRHD